MVDDLTGTLSDDTTLEPPFDLVVDGHALNIESRRCIAMLDFNSPSLRPNQLHW